CCPTDSESVGLTSASRSDSPSFSPGISITSTRCATPTWFPARPTPRYACMVSTMSATSCASGSSKLSIGRAFCRRTGSPYMRTGRMAMPRLPKHSLRFRLFAEHLHHGALGELDADVVGDLQRGLVVVDSHHRADDAAGRDHPIALLELGE